MAEAVAAWEKHTASKTHVHVAGWVTEKVESELFVFSKKVIWMLLKTDVLNGPLQTNPSAYSAGYEVDQRACYNNPRLICIVLPIQKPKESGKV